MANLLAIAQGNYFQQKVNYYINVTLDDKNHQINGDITIDYTNNAPHELTEIWMHIWPNAFKNTHTAYCHQTLRQGSDKFYFSPKTDRGECKLLDFSVNGAKATWNYDPKHPDIARITLQQPLKSGQTIQIKTPFLVQIPSSFSRLGHVETSYQMTQWFPKPAVFDQYGWHPMPYLNQGEFFSEFGNFDVKITLPENYIVGATGLLMTNSEKDFLATKAIETQQLLQTLEKKPTQEKGKRRKTVEDPFPASATSMKTLHYQAENVHDFAWFADKRFLVVKDTAQLASGKTIDCWAMFTQSDVKHWKKGAFYVKRAIEFYSKHVGDYPWPQATAVHSALSAGGGMEYPMVTVIGNTDSDYTLDQVITHEVGHNWFYGILASNERDHPWMDEGLNSYYEQRYLRTYYGDNNMNMNLPKALYDPQKHGNLLETGILLLARIGENTPPDLNSDHMTNAAYGLQVYMKTAHCLRWLENAVGTSQFDTAMKNYFQKWRFKHPYPIDFEQALKANGLEAEWFMKTMTTRQNADPAIVRVSKKEDNSYELTVRQRGQLLAPFSITALSNGKEVTTQWFSPTKNQSTYLFPSVEADAFELNHQHLALDLRHQNNHIKTKGALKKAEPIEVKLLAPVENHQKKTLGILPWIGGNHYNGLMVGTLLYNPILPGQRLQYYLAPGFAFGNSKWVGGADLRYRLIPSKGRLKRITIGLNARSFSDDHRPSATDQFGDRFYRISPWLKTEFRSSNTALRQAAQVRWNHIGQEGGLNAKGIAQETFISNVWETQYQLSNLALPHPFDLTIGLEGQSWHQEAQHNQYLRLSAEWKQSFFYQPKRSVQLRFFGGYFLQNSLRNSESVGFTASQQRTRGAFSLAQNGYSDYKYDALFMGRNEAAGLGGRQVNLAEGGFKYAFGWPYSNSGNVGHSNNLLLAVNLSADLPFKIPGLPIRPYYDAGFADLGFLNTNNTAPNWFWSGGLTLAFLKGNLNVHLPLINSSNLETLYNETSNGNYFRRITWSVKLNNLEPLEIADRFIK
jgi:hypothetical protein